MREHKVTVIKRQDISLGIAISQAQEQCNKFTVYLAKKECEIASIATQTMITIDQMYCFIITIVYLEEVKP